MIKINLVKNLKSLFSLIKCYKPLFLLSYIIDFVFIIVSLFSFTASMLPIYDLLGKISDQIKELSNLSQQLQTGSINAEMISISSKISDHIADLLLKFLALAATMLLIWIVFQGINFALAAKITDKKTGFWQYFGKFSFFSTFFYIFVILSFYLTINLAMMNNGLPIPVFNQTVITVILVILLIIILYFWLLSLVLARKKSIIPTFLATFSMGCRRFLQIVVIFQLLLFLTLFSTAIFLFCFWWNIWISYLCIILLLIPMISILRIALFYFIEKLAE
jgi:hypothetical protein